MTHREIWTIGHWSCPEPVFLDTLHEARVEVVADVRHPSRRTSRFSPEQMAGWLAEDGLDFVQLPALADRQPAPEVDPAVNAAWRSARFHSYADHALTGPYEEDLGRLAALAGDRRVAVLGAEPMPWMCHRALLASTLTARGWTVWHLVNGARPRRHELGRWGPPPSVDAHGVVTYPRQEGGAA